MGDMLQIIQNVTALLPNLQVLLGVISFIIGVIFVITAFRGFAKAGAGSGANMGGPTYGSAFTMLLIGACFVALPGLINTLTLTFFNTGHPSAESIFSYAPQTVGLLQQNGTAKTTIVGIVSIVQFIGIIAVMRGLLLLNQTARGGHGPKTFGPGLTFLIAGTMAVNFPLFVGMVESLITSNGG